MAFFKASSAATSLEGAILVYTDLVQRCSQQLVAICGNIFRAQETIW